jgi:hypothetical protein
VPEDIEADAHVGDGGGSEGGDFLLHRLRRRYKWAPR